MYLEHFGLAEPPFTITPHTEFFFAGANRGATLEALIYAIMHGEGIVKVSGEVGSGKTMLCRVLMERLPATVATVYLAIPSLKRDEMLAAICADLGVSTASLAPNALLKALQEHLLRLHMEGGRVVAMIDEAHAMPLDSLEEIRLLSNLETNRAKLLQIVLFGQPELDENLARPQMRQLRERITHSFRLSPLTLEEVQAYLRHRLAAAGYKGAEVFNARCVKIIAAASQGLTRRVNIIADKSLLAAFSDNSHAVNANHVRAAIQDSAFAVLAPKTRRSGWLVATAMTAGLAIGATGATWFTLNGGKGAEMAADAATLVSPPGVSGPGVSASASDPPVVDARKPPVVEARKLDPPAVEPPARQPVEPAAIVAIAPASAARPETSDKPIAEPAAPASAMAHNAAANNSPAAEAQTLPERISASEQWLAQVDAAHWVVQLTLANAGEVQQLQQFIAASEQVLGHGSVHAYPLTVNGIAKTGVIYGSFATREQAQAALAGLPAKVAEFNPYVRSIRLIRSEAGFSRSGEAG